MGFFLLFGAERVNTLKKATKKPTSLSQPYILGRMGDRR